MIKWYEINLRNIFHMQAQQGNIREGNFYFIKYIQFHHKANADTIRTDRENLSDLVNTHYQLHCLLIWEGV